MGLGKTLMAIAACETLSARKSGTFNLVITTKSTMRQWKDALSSNFDSVRRMLDNP